MIHLSASPLSQFPETKLEDCISEVSRLVLLLCRERILSRMRLFLGQPPGFVRGGKAATNNAGPASTLERMRDVATTPTARELVDGVSEMKKTFENILHPDSSLSEDVQLLQLEAVVHQCFVTTTKNGQASFRTTLKTSGFEPSIWFKNKYIMQIDKLGAYRRIPETLVREARRERSRVVFSKIELQFARPYAPKMSWRYHTGKRVYCHVHAEVQLVTHYLLSSSPVLPRVMGTSKEACFLCHLFISKHGAFEVSAKHGRLFDQWTIPDLAEYSPENVTKLRAIIKEMIDECKRLARLTHPWRPYPLTSRHNLRELPHFSPTASALGSKPDVQADGVSVTSGQESGENARLHSSFESSGQQSVVSTNSRRLSSLHEIDPASVPPRSDIVPSSSEGDEKSPESLVLGQIRSRESSRGRSSASTARLVGQCQIRVCPDEAQFIDVSPDLEIRAEIEAPCSGVITLTRGKKATRKLGVRDNGVNLDDLKVGQEMEFQRRDDENGILLHLERGQSQVCSLSLRWA